MNLIVYCQNCLDHILMANSEDLKHPLNGSMFRVKPDMEWDIFSSTAVGNDLVCPICGWCFHYEGQLLTNPPTVFENEVYKLKPDENTKFQIEEEPIKRMGRPVGSKNKPKRSRNAKRVRTTKRRNDKGREVGEGSEEVGSDKLLQETQEVGELS
jgi:hypothetical protein